MEKVLKFLEKYVQWIALGLGGLFLLAMVYNYVLQDPVTVTLGGKDVLPGEIDKEIARLNDIEHQVAYVDVPLSYMEEFYHLRLHLGMLQQHLAELRRRGAPEVEAAKP